MCHFGSGAELLLLGTMGFFNESDDDAPSSRFIVARAEEPPPLLIRKKEKAKLNAMTVAYSWVVDAFWSWAMTASMCIPTVGDGEGEFSILVELSGLGLAKTGIRLNRQGSEYLAAKHDNQRVDMCG